MDRDLPELTAALGAQWARLSAWLEPLGDDVHGLGDAPSALPGWTVSELVAHLGRAMDALTAVEPAVEGMVPLTLAEYLGTYPQRAAEITTVTKELAARIAAAPLREVDRLARTALRRLDELGPDGDRVVQARRGPVTLRDMAASRLIELVVHADDLVRSLASTVDATGPRDPRDPAAVRIVADELLAIVVAREGWDLEVADALPWVRLATGRQPYDTGALARALRPRYTAGGVPDLGRMLPVL